MLETTEEISNDEGSSMIDANKLAELRKAAGAATRGKWEKHDGEEDQGGWNIVVGGESVISSSEWGGVWNEADADFIANAQPATVLELLDHIDALTKERDGLTALVEAAEQVRDEARCEMKETKRRLDGADFELKERDKTLARVRDECDQLDEANEGMEQELAVVRKERDQARAEVAALKIANESLKEYIARGVVAEMDKAGIWRAQ